MRGRERVEIDSMGEVRVAADALWGAQTQRAIDNFSIAGRAMPAAFVHALGLVKAEAARVNGALGLLDETRARAIADAADSVAAGAHDDAFPVDVFQTGSGTSSNMNANEVVARLASRAGGFEVSPNDDVNLGQSSNDVVPTALHLAAARAVREQLRPALAALLGVLRTRSEALADVAKTGRTHLMDAMPLTFGQELGAWASQVAAFDARLGDLEPRLCTLAIGGTAVGSGVNAHPDFGARVAERLAARTGLPLQVDPDRFRALAAQETSAELAGQLRTGAIAFTKIANDLRWMNSGPLAGLGEIELEALQPGSSIMPGKVNPVLPEAVAMASARVVGLDATVAAAAASGNFQLNVMLPVIADSLLEAIGLLTGSADALARTVRGFRVREARVEAPLARNPILVAALNPVIGYLEAARIAKRAFAEGRPVLDVAEEMTELSRAELERLLDPRRLTGGGLGEG
jgi:fumarate hydratase class II